MVEVELDGVAPGGVDLPDALRVGGRGVGKTGRRQLQVGLNSRRTCSHIRFDNFFAIALNA